MKINLIRALDRLAILISIPIAISSFENALNDYLRINTVEVIYPKIDENEAVKIYDQLIANGEKNILPSSCHLLNGPAGVIAKGVEEINKCAHKCPALKIALDHALQKGGDVNGILINGKGYGFNAKNALYLLPNTTKSYLWGILWAIGAALGFIFAIGIITRSFRWVIRGLFLP